MITLLKRTPAQLAREVIAELDDTYELVYVDYRDQLNDKQKAALVAGDFESLDCDADFEDWQSECQHQSVKTTIDELVAMILDRWQGEDDDPHTQLADDFEFSPEWDTVREAILDRDTSNTIKQLVGQSGSVLLRINVIDEDHGYAFQPVTPEEVLTATGLPVSASNVATMQATLNECSPEYSVLLGYWIVGAELSDLYELPYTCREVRLINPYLYLGNPFSGSGYISDQPFEGTVRVPRQELRTDQDAFGYSVTEVFGGLYPSSFQCEIKPIVNLSKEIQ